MGLSTFELFKHIKNTSSTIELTGDSLCSLQNVLKMMLQMIFRLLQIKLKLDGP